MLLWTLSLCFFIITDLVDSDGFGIGLARIIDESLQTVKLLRLLLDNISLPVLDILACDAGAFLPLVIVVPRHPLDQLAAVPEALFLHKIELVSHVAHAILDSVPPVAPVRLGAKLPQVRSLTVPLVVPELALVLTRTV